MMKYLDRPCVHESTCKQDLVTRYCLLVTDMAKISSRMVFYLDTSNYNRKQDILSMGLPVNCEKNSFPEMFLRILTDIKPSGGVLTGIQFL